MSKIINYESLIGRKFNKLTILQINKNHTAICKCDCGNVKEIRVTKVINNHTISCGCSKGRPKTYDMKNNRLARIWRCMINRCHKGKYYKGKGINVCDEWKDDYCKFENWAYKSGYNDKLSIDRIDVRGNYEPNNCRWTNNHVQMANTDVCKRNKSGYKGVCFDKKEEKWRSDITVNGKRYYLGLFETIEDAYSARVKFIEENKLNEYNKY